MIVPMAKVFLVARQTDRERLLQALRELGVVHLTPLDPTRAALDEKTAGGIRDVERVIQILGGVTPSGSTPETTPAEVVREVLEIQIGRAHV